MISKLNWNN